MDLTQLTLEVEQRITIHAATADVFEGMLRKLSDHNTRPDQTGWGVFFGERTNPLESRWPKKTPHPFAPK